MAPTLCAPALFPGHDPRTHWERPVSSEVGTHHISGFCLFCPFPPAAHPLITSSLGRQCNNRTKAPGFFPFVFLSFEARQLRRAITPMAHHGPAHCPRGGRGAPRHRHQHQVTPGADRQGRAGRAGTHPTGLPSAPQPWPSPTTLALSSHAFTSRQAIISSRTTEFSPETEAAPPLLPPAHGMEAFRLVFAEFTQISPSPFPTPPSPHN